MWMNYNLFDSITTSDQLGCFHCFALRNNTSRNIFVHVTLCLGTNGIDSSKCSFQVKRHIHLGIAYRLSKDLLTEIVLL